MSGLFGAIGQGLSSAGYAAGEMYAKGALMDSQNEAEMQRAMRLAEFQQNLKDAPLKRLQDIAGREAGVEVPVQAAPVSRLSGAGLISTDGNAPDSSGFSGDPKVLLKQIMALKDGPDKEQALAQLKAQYGADASANEAAVAGQTRKRTPEEALDAALEAAKTSDLAAYAAGKPLVGEKTISVPDGGTIIDRNGKVIFSSANSKDEREAKREDRRDERAREAEDARDRRQLQALAAADARAAMLADGRAPSGYRKTEDGNLTFIPGGPADPENKNKPLPASAAKALLENQANLRTAQKALTLANGEIVGKSTGDKAATGFKGYLPNGALNRIDPEGVDTRAAIADIGSMVIHDRSGAAVSATEFPRLRPFIPAATDDSETVKKKLGLFVQNYEAIIGDMTSFYRESGYKVPTDVLRSGNAAAPTRADTLPTVSDLEAEMRRRGILK